MAAEDNGYTQGREYLLRQFIERMTFEDYRRQGKVTSEKLYVREEKQREFLRGWWHAGEQAHVLFKLEDTDYRGGEKRIQALRANVGDACTKMEALLEWRKGDHIIQGFLIDAYHAIDQAQNDLDAIVEHLKQPEKLV